MWSIATATVSFAEVGFWLGIGLWTLLLGSVWGMARTRTTRKLDAAYRTRSSTSPKPLNINRPRNGTPNELVS